MRITSRTVTVTLETEKFLDKANKVNKQNRSGSDTPNKQPVFFSEKQHALEGVDLYQPNGAQFHTDLVNDNEVPLQSDVIDAEFEDTSGKNTLSTSRLVPSETTRAQLPSHNSYAAVSENNDDTDAVKGEKISVYV
ncbi:hypothetical protein BVY03_04930 [bacterium K02(2017)]|nr:hypothetical protein BVY03_04930 [bacterium K02(2017)]